MSILVKIYSMTKEFLVHSLFLLSAVFVTWLWTSNPDLNLYNLQFIGLFVLFYFISHFLSRSTSTTTTIDALIFTIIILLLVASTGGLSSPLFFLIYFLLFAVSLLFEPAITFTLTLALVAFFWPSPLTPNAAIQLLSVILILPLAIFLGKQYLHALEAREEIKILKIAGRQLEKHLSSQETNTLFWLSLNLKENLLVIMDRSSDLLTGLGKITPSQKESLEKIHSAAKELLKSGAHLERQIDRETDER